MELEEEIEELELRFEQALTGASREHLVEFGIHMSVPGVEGEHKENKNTEANTTFVEHSEEDSENKNEQPNWRD